MADQKATKQEIEAVRDLFGLAHDLIAQATYPGHLSEKVTSVMKFLAFQYNDFKARAEALAPVVEAVKQPEPAVAEAPKA